MSNKSERDRVTRFFTLIWDFNFLIFLQQGSFFTFVPSELQYHDASYCCVLGGLGPNIYKLTKSFSILPQSAPPLEPLYISVGEPDLDPKDPLYFAGSGSIIVSTDPDPPPSPLLLHTSTLIPHTSSLIPQNYSFTSPSSSLTFPPSSITLSPSSLTCTPHLSSLIPHPSSLTSLLPLLPYP